MSVTLKINVEQLADAFMQLSPTEAEKLEQLIDQKATSEILKRSKEAHRGKYITVEEAAAFKNID